MVVVVVVVHLLGLVVRHLGDPSLLLVRGVLDGADLVVGLEQAVFALHFVAFALFLLVLDVVGVLVPHGVFVVEFGVGLQKQKKKIVSELHTKSEYNQSVTRTYFQKPVK